jgi:hypothetical protein
MFSEENDYSVGYAALRTEVSLPKSCQVVDQAPLTEYSQPRTAST